MSQSNNNAANLKLVKNDELNEVAEETSVSSSKNAQLTPGELLKLAREKKELAISTIGKQLKLDNRSVEALERNEFESIGAPVFVKGHLRKYASIVELDPNDIMFAYHQVARTQDSTPVISQTTPMTAKRPKMAWVGKLFARLVMLALLAALVYGLYQLWQWYVADAKSATDTGTTELSVPGAENTVSLPSRDDVIATSSSAVTSVNNAANNVSTSLSSENTLSLPAKSGETTASSGPNSSNVASGNDFAQPTSDNTAATNVANQSVASESVAASSISSSTASNPVSAVGDELRLVFTDNCWVRIRDEDGKSLMNGIAYAGNQKQFTLSGSTEIELGNADGVQLYLNGETYQIPAGAQRGNKAHFRLVPQS